jgi:hypothetical protein
LQFLGHFAGEFWRSLGSFEGDLNQKAHNIEDERAIATPSHGLCNPGAGGVLNYRAVYPKDPVLRFWSGLTRWTAHLNRGSQEQRSQ